MRGGRGERRAAGRRERGESGSARTRISWAYSHNSRPRSPEEAVLFPGKRSRQGRVKSLENGEAMNKANILEQVNAAIAKDGGTERLE